MAKWTKPNGTEIETNDDKATIEHCESLDWKRQDKVIQGDPEVKPRPKIKFKKVKAKAKVASPAANPKPMKND